ncbi:MAG: hypothetical protein KA120_07175 [Candidatus Goldbacteria bacterium]|nr:hypothetical protein [Candidatus Goldiibacteriota bacterium]
MKKKLFIFIIVILILIVLLFILFFMLQKPEKIKKKGIIELPEKEQKIVEKSIKEKIIISGKKEKVTDYNVYFFKVTPSGGLLWQKSINNEFIDWAEFAFQTIENDIFLICRVYDINEMRDKFYVIKSDENGNPIWQKDFEDFFSNEEKIFKTKEGYLTIGRTLTNEKNDNNIYVSAADYNNNYLWIKNFGSKYYSWGNFTLISKDGAYLIGEDDDYPELNFDFYITKKDATGKNLWIKTYGINEADKGYSIMQGIDGGYVLTGVSYLFNDEKNVSYLIKIDDDGNIIWKRIFSGTGNDEIFCIAKDDDSGYLLAGTTDSDGAGLYDVYLLKTDLNGNELWKKTFGGNGNDAAYYITGCNDGNFIIAGVTQK